MGRRHSKEATEIINKLLKCPSIFLFVTSNSYNFLMNFLFLSIIPWPQISTTWKLSDMITEVCYVAICGHFQHVYKVSYMICRYVHYLSSPYIIRLSQMVHQLLLPNKLIYTILQNIEDWYVLQTSWQSVSWLNKIISNGHTHKFPQFQQNKQTPWPLARKRTTPTERPPFVDEI
jgi:hypothetical protein